MSSWRDRGKRRHLGGSSSPNPRLVGAPRKADRRTSRWSKVGAATLTLAAVLSMLAINPGLATSPGTASPPRHDASSNAAAPSGPPTPPLVAATQTPPTSPGPAASIDLTKLEAPPALPPGKATRIELVERRTASSKTFATDRAGQFETLVSPTPIHYEDANGHWADIDATLGAPTNGRRHNQADGSDVSLAAKADDGAVARVSLDDDHSISFSLEGASPAAGEAAGATMTYPEARKATDLRLVSRPSGLKEDLVLASAGAPDRFVFPLQLKGLSASIDGSGDVVYRDQKGAIRARTPHGFMTDSLIDPRSGDPATSYGVTYSLIPNGKDGRAQALEVALDRAWLDDPARVWPITVDPTTAVATGADDTFVMSGVHANNSGSTELKVGTFDGGATVARSFLRFDGVSPAINGKIVNSAQLHVNETWSYSCSPRQMNVHRVTQGWVGSDLLDFPGRALDPNPVGGASFAMGYGSGCPVGLAVIDVTPAAAGWAANPASNFGLALRAADEGDSYAWKKFGSFDTGAPPALHVVWTDPASAPGAPAAAVASPVNQGATVTWGAAPNGGAAVDLYGVWAYTYPGLSVVGSASACGTCTSVAVGGLTNGQQHVFVAYAHNAVGWGPGAVTNVVTPAPTPPSPPASASGVGRNASANVSWPLSTNNGGAAIDTYGVFAYTYPGSAYVTNSFTPVCGTCTSATVTGLTNGQKYVFTVYAKNALGWSTSAAITNVVTAVPTPPTAPATVVAAPGNASATIAWSTPADNGGSAITGYYIFRYSYPSLTYQVFTQACATCTSTTVTGLTNGSAYQFLVMATNGAGSGPYTWSNPVTAGASADLLAPTNVLATRGDHRIDLTWMAPITRLLVPVSYTMTAFRASDNTQLGSPIAVPATSSATVAAAFTGLANGVPAYVRVTATTLIFITSSPTQSNTVKPAGAPLAPTAVSAAIGDRRAEVTWAAPDANGEPIARYTVTASPGGAAVDTQDGSTTHATLEGLTNGTAYTITVSATNAVGRGPESGSPGPVTPAGQPFPPERVTATPGQGQATVSWDPPPARADGTPGDNGSPITGYTVTASPGGQQATTNGSTTSVVVSGLDDGTSYWFRVSATNSHGESDLSIPSVPTTPVSAPTTPTDVSAYARDASAMVTWRPSAANGGAVTYTVVASPGGATTTTKSVTTNFGGLTNGVAYTFTVRATNSAGTSATSAPSSPVTPQSVEMPPTGPGCQTSPLPAPPGEVRVEPGSILRRINVTCIPELGRVRMGFFIKDREVTPFPFGPVIGRGDNRGFDSHTGPANNRFYIEVDYATGTGYIQVNRSCKSLNDNSCTQAQSLVNHFSSVSRPDGSITLDFSIGDAAVGETPILGKIEVSGHLEIFPVANNDVCVTGSASRYPSIEAYHDRLNGNITTIFQVSQSGLGPIAMAGSDHGLPGC